MSILGFLSSPFVEVIDWAEQPGELAIRYQPGKRTLKNGAQLTVREGQVAVFYNEGQADAVFGPGLHALETDNLPILTALANWDKGFASPYMSDLYFYSTKEQIGLTWGTSQPIMARDPVLGSVAIRAFGRYAFRIDKVAIVATRLMGAPARLTVDDVEPQLRAAIAEALPAALGDGPVDVAALADDPGGLSQRLHERVQPAFAAWGLECTTFLVESVTLPDSLRNRPPAAPDDPYAAIERLHALLISGAITQTDYDAKKAALLARIG